uniref:Amino_oxidase domain-containing protein n=1 Tax=Meloidogyne javanica TaxID=6303 RepID=A0A915MUH0_MELJA
MRIVCIGCAPTTLGFAYRLNEIIKEGIEDVDDIELIVLEKEMKPGGLSGTIRDEHGFLWDMGGHITFSHNFPYYEKATKEAVKEWNNLERNCMVDLNYLYGESGINLVPYPAQFAVPLFPEETKRKCLSELKQRYEDFPKYGGTGAVWEKMEQMLPSKWFKYGTKVIKIDYNKKRLVYTNTEEKEHRLSYDILINSGPIDLLVEQTKICTPLQLKHNKVIIVGVGYGDVTPDSSKYWSVMCDCALPCDDPRDSELSRCHSILEEYQIYSRGRFGGWKYEVSNQDHCFIQGKELCDRLVLGENEKLYKTLVPEKRG